MPADNVIPLRPDNVIELTVRPDPSAKQPDAYAARCPEHGLIERVPIGRSAKTARGKALNAAGEHGRIRHSGKWCVR